VRIEDIETRKGAPVYSLLPPMTPILPLKREMLKRNKRRKAQLSFEKRNVEKEQKEKRTRLIDPCIWKHLEEVRLLYVEL
jgi:hypothetical protein